MADPWFPFYGGDWRRDAGLRACSFAARGLWADCLTLMHEAQPYGFLLLNGLAPSSRDLARVLGGHPREIEKLIAELRTRGVFSVSEDGTVYSRRMVRDAKRRATNAANGRRGGNPLLRDSDNNPDKRPPQQSDKPDVIRKDKAYARASQIPESDPRSGDPLRVSPDARETLAPLMRGGSHRAHATCGRPCVPASLHEDFVRKRGGDPDAADTALRTWYLQTMTDWEQKPLPASDFDFWRLRYDETWPIAKPPPLSKAMQAAVSGTEAALRRRGFTDEANRVSHVSRGLQSPRAQVARHATGPDGDEG